MAILEIIPSDKMASFTDPGRIRGLCLYNQPEFLQLVAPQKSFYAQIENSKGEIAYFPFCGQKLLFWWRVFQVPFCQRFEPFGLDSEPDEEHWTAWFSFLISSVFPFDYAFGPGTLGAQEMIPELRMKANQFLDLSPPFEEILKGWKSGRRSVLKKSETFRVDLLGPEEFREDLRQVCRKPIGKGWRPNRKERSRILAISESDFFRPNLYRFAVKHRKEILCLVLLLEWNGRYHYLFSMSSEEGFAGDALTRFFYDFFSNHSGEPGFFDFEGSSLPGVHAFFKSLGAVEEAYFIYSKGLFG
jgi:hypothetical protein